MDGSDRPTAATPDAPAAPARPKFSWKVVALVVAAAAAACALFIIDGPNAPEDTPAKLCTLLRAGWTPSELAINDEWRDWSEHQSPRSRAMDIASAANQGGCLELV